MTGPLVTQITCSMKCVKEASVMAVLFRHWRPLFTPSLHHHHHQLPPFLLRLFSSSSSPGLESGGPKPLPTLQPCADAEMISQLLLQQHNPFHAMESSLQLNGITLTPYILHQTLLRLKNSSKIAFSFFNYVHHHYHHHPSCSSLLDSSFYDILIDIMAKVRQFDVAWRLIVDMDQRKINPTATTFSVLIRRLISAGLTRHAIRAFDDMGCFLDSGGEDSRHQDFLFLLDTLCKYGYPKVATEIFNKWKHSRFQPDAKAYTILIYGWCKINRPKMAERFFKEMVDVGIEPNVVTYNVLLNGICRRSSLHPEGRFERTIRDADNLLDEMRQRGIDPDVTSYSIVLHVYSRAHKPDLCTEKLKLMKEKGISPTVASYTSVVKCLCSCGRIDDAEVLLDEMVASGVSPSAATYNCFFKEYKGRSDGDSALKLYRRMKGVSLCLPSLHTYHILVGMFVKMDRMKIVKEVWDDMKERGVGPDLDSYTLLVHGFCEKQKWRDACHYFVEMIEKGILPQKVTFETLYRGLIQSDMLRTWRRLKKKLEEESISFGSEFQHYHFQPYKR